MSNDLNKCLFIGRLGGDPEVRYLPSGSALASFSIAVGEKWKDKQSGEKQERTEWINITAFGKLGEICGEYLKKGSQVMIEGKFKTDKYEKEGVTMYSTKIIASNMQMLGSKSQHQSDQASQYQQNNQQQPAHQQQPSQGVARDADFDDDIPF